MNEPLTQSPNRILSIQPPRPHPIQGKCRHPTSLNAPHQHNT